MRVWSKIPGFEWTAGYPFKGAARIESWEGYWRHRFTGSIVPVPIAEFQEEGHWLKVTAPTPTTLAFVTYALMSERVITYDGRRGPNFRRPNITAPSWRLVTTEGTHSYKDKWGNIRQPLIRKAVPEFFLRTAS
jgi:hypothetical protein